MLNITICGQYHHKNKYFLDKMCKKYFNYVNTINEADIVLSADKYIDITLYPNKFFILGPHFSVFPNDIVKKFNNKHNNACYIHPSEQCGVFWRDIFNFNNLEIFPMPCGVNMDYYKPNCNRTKVLVYYKYRNPDELRHVEDFLKKKNIEYKVFDYRKKYKESDYINYLNECKYGIWVGCHESQGFALNEALSCNVPLLVWNVKLFNQQYMLSKELIIDKNIYLTTIPYWDETCGEFFYEKDEIEEKYKNFINKLNEYKPRDFIMKRLSIEELNKVWYEFIMDMYSRLQK